MCVAPAGAPCTPALRPCLAQKAGTLTLNCGILPVSVLGIVIVALTVFRATAPTVDAEKKRSNVKTTMKMK
jgi:hypothetical protein